MMIANAVVWKDSRLHPSLQAAVPKVFFVTAASPSKAQF